MTQNAACFVRRLTPRPFAIGRMHIFFFSLSRRLQKLGPSISSDKFSNWQLTKVAMIDELALWLIPVLIGVWLVQSYALFIVGGFVLYFLVSRALERVSIGRLSERPVMITGFVEAAASSARRRLDSARLGCDSGFGWGLALRCVREGMPVFAACYDENVRQRATWRAKPFFSYGCRVASDCAMRRAKLRATTSALSPSRWTCEATKVFRRRANWSRASWPATKVSTAGGGGVDPQAVRRSLGPRQQCW